MTMSIDTRSLENSVTRTDNETRGLGELKGHRRKWRQWE